MMADTAPVMIWMSDADAGCTFLNKPWLDFTGRTMVQDMGDGWVEGVHPKDVAHCFNTYQSSFKARQPFTMEYRLRRADGEYRWVVDTGVPRMTRRHLAGYIGSCIDITDVSWPKRDCGQVRNDTAPSSKSKPSSFTVSTRYHAHLRQ